MNYERKRVVVCAFCRYFMYSEHFSCWFCSLHHHLTEVDDRCTFGDEVEEGDVE